MPTPGSFRGERRQRLTRDTDYPSAAPSRLISQALRSPSLSFHWLRCAVAPIHYRANLSPLRVRVRLDTLSATALRIDATGVRPAITHHLVRLLCGASPQTRNPKTDPQQQRHLATCPYPGLTTRSERRPPRSPFGKPRRASDLSLLHGSHQ